MRYRLQRHDGTDCSATMVPITVLRMVPIQRYRQFEAETVIPGLTKARADEMKTIIMEYIQHGTI